MLRALVLAVVAVTAASCIRESPEIAKARDSYWGVPGIRAMHMGNMTEDRIAYLKSECGKIRFPTKMRDSVLVRLIPSRIKPRTVMIDDMFGKAGEPPRNGGTVVDYWLNETTVLRAGISYGRPPETEESILWIQFLDPIHAYTDPVQLRPDGMMILVK